LFLVEVRLSFQLKLLRLVVVQLLQFDLSLLECSSLHLLVLLQSLLLELHL